MNLLEVLRNLGRQDPDATIWIESEVPWSAESRVVVAHEPENGGAPTPRFDYFLEISIILEQFGEMSRDPERLTQRVIHYAKFDA
jgi:hypothetical protein